MTPPVPEPADALPVEELLAHREWVRAFAGALVRDPADADDLAQDAWAGALRSPPARGTKVRAWFATVLRNRARDRHRRAVVAEDAHRNLSAAPDATADSPAAIAERAEMERLAIAAVLELDEPFRDAVLLRFWRGMEPAEIAKLRGVPAATVRTRLHRALAQVRERLDSGPGARRWRVVLVPWFGATRGLPDGDARSGSWTGPAAAAAIVALIVAGTVLALRGPAATESVAVETELATRASAPVRPEPAPRAQHPRAAPSESKTPEPAAAPTPSATDAVVTATLRVRRADGTPVSDAQFLLLPSWGGKAPESIVVLLAMVGGAEAGTFVTPWPEGDDPRRVLVRSGELSGLSPRIEGPSKDVIDVRLAASTTIAGRVTDAAGHAVAGADVRLGAEVEDEEEMLARVQTGADGAFRIDGVPAEVLAKHPVVSTRAPGYVQVWTLLDGTDVRPDRVEVTLVRSMVVKGRILDGAGRPVSDVTIDLPGCDNVFTGADGRFETPGTEPGRLRLAVIPDEHAPVAIHVGTGDSGTFDAGDIVLRDGLPLAGRVVLPDGRPARNAWIGVDDPSVNQIVRQTMTDADGRFRFEHLGDGPLELSAHDEGADTESGATATMTDVRAGATDVVVTLSAGQAVVVSLVDADTGGAFAAEFVVVSIESAEPGPDGAPTTITSAFDARDDSGRRYRVAVPRPGVWTVSVRVRGCEDVASEKIEVRAGEPSPRIVRVRRAK